MDYQKIEGNAGTHLESCSGRLEGKIIEKIYKAVAKNMQRKGVGPWAQIRGRRNKRKDVAKVSSFIK